MSFVRLFGALVALEGGTAVAKEEIRRARENHEDTSRAAMAGAIGFAVGTAAVPVTAAMIAAKILGVIRP